MALVSWRYLWATTPLHRTEDHAQSPVGHEPPSLPSNVSHAEVRPAQRGHGPLFHRLYRIRIDRPRLGAAELIEAVRRDFGGFVPREVVRVHTDGNRGPATVGDELVVDMPGPWNGPVVVVAADSTRLRFATLNGHLEAGQIEFRACAQDGQLVFEIESWACASSRAVHLLYSKVRLAKEIQLNMWVRFCQSAAKTAGGRAVDGVEIRTVKVSTLR